MRTALALTAVLLGSVSGGPALAQPAEKAPERLFRSREILDLTLLAPLRTLFKNRDTIEKTPQDGRLVVRSESGSPDTIPVRLETRGHFRLKSSTCQFPPIKVYFDKSEAKSTPFKGQGSLKLATHCRSRDRYEQNLLVEEAMYRLYNVLTPYSHRTRLARIRYVPAEDTSKAETKLAFFLEDDDEMAKRNGGVNAKIPALGYGDMDPRQLDLMSVFVYMIGNHDWSIYALHNTRIVQVQGATFMYPVAYDFDFSGAVNAPYAGPPVQLPIKRLRERLYRGPCRPIDELVPTLEAFTAKRDTLLAVIRDQPELKEGRIKDVSNFLKDFFDEIKTPRYFDDKLRYACRGR